MCSSLWVTNIPLCIYTATSLSIPRFWVFFLSHTAPGFQLWFYFHLYMWVAHWGLVPEAALGGSGLPLRGPGAEVVHLLGSQGSGSTRFSGVGWWLGQQETQRSRRVWPPVVANTSSILAWRTPLRQGRRVGQDGSDPVLINTRLFCVCLWQPCPSESWLWRCCSCFACGDPGRPKGSGT